MRNVNKIQAKIIKNGFTTTPLKQAMINKEPIDLAAAIGGDGTFLRAAGWIRDSRTGLG